MRALKSLLAAIVLSAAVGCGSNAVPVSGTVTYNDEPVANAVVTFIPEQEGDYGTATTNEQGQFDTVTTRSGEAGLAPGKYEIGVTVVKPRSADEQVINYAPDPPPPFPAKYINSATSGLTVTVESNGPQTVDLKLTD